MGSIRIATPDNSRVPMGGEVDLGAVFSINPLVGGARIGASVQKTGRTIENPPLYALQIRCYSC